ncbi:MAG TPA: FAD-dependent oxidoreductase, partial [Candidatus Moranbacteria bacterium]|nr:FAD-dependent oxidoreductase [Candidatus Moranbacteria bacterium]
MEKTDITIIGAGVVGLAIAYVLSEEGKEVIVVEK